MQARLPDLRFLFAAYPGMRPYQADHFVALTQQGAHRGLAYGAGCAQHQYALRLRGVQGVQSFKGKLGAGMGQCSVRPRHPHRGALRAVALGMRHIARQPESVAGREMADAAIHR